MATSDEFYMDFDCVSSSKKKIATDEWRLCKTENDRASILKKSTFTLIPCVMDERLISTPIFLLRLFESLKYGAIPVILGVDQVELPFDEVRVNRILLINFYLDTKVVYFIFRSSTGEKRP